MCRLISAAVCARTSSRSSDAFTSSPISANVASTSAEVSGLSVCGVVCSLGSVASMYPLIITGVPPEVPVEQAPFCANRSRGRVLPHKWKRVLLVLCFSARPQLQHAHIRQIPVALVKIQSVAHHKFIRDREPRVIGFHVRNAALHLVQQHCHAQVLRFPLFKQFQQIFKRQSGVQDILHDKHRAPLNADVEVLGQLHFPRRIRALAVTRYPEKIESYLAAQISRKIRKKKDRPFQHPDQMQRVIRKVPPDFPRHLRHLRPDARMRYQLAQRFAWAVSFLFFCCLLRADFAHSPLLPKSDFIPHNPQGTHWSPAALCRCRSTTSLL